jgi:hypothetical protein
MAGGIPESLPGRVYLLAYDPTRRRLTSRGELGVVVRAAVLTELFLGGRLSVVKGSASVEGMPTGTVLTEIERSRPRTWSYWVNRGDRAAARAVRD